MTLAKILLKLWVLRLWVGVGVLLGVVAAVGSVTTSHSTVYASASTQMLVDSTGSALGNAGVDLTGYTARANVFARLMTSTEALRYIGNAAGIPGNLIDANGPLEVNGSPTATHAPVRAPAAYKLSFVQNPSLPTVDVYAQAPTTAQAISLANGAVTGFANFINQLNANNVPHGKRIEIRQLGGATGGIVDPSASKKIAVLIFFAVLAIWCGVVLFASRLRAQLRAAKRVGADDLFAIPEDELTSAHAPGMGKSPPLGDFPEGSAPAADARAAAANGGPVDHALASAGAHHSHPHHPTPDAWDPEKLWTPHQEDAHDGVGPRS